MSIVGKIKKSFYQVQTSPGCNFFVVNIRLNLQYFRRGAVAGLLSKAENIGISQDLLEQRELTLSVLPVPVKQVHGEQSLESLCLKAELESFHQQNETGSVLDAEAGVIQLIDDLLPVESCLELVDSFDEHFHVPGLVILVFFLPETVSVRGYG